MSQAKRPAQSPRKAGTPASNRSSATSSSSSRSGRSGRPGGRPNAATVAPAGPRDWIAGARLRTLPLAVAPVAIGAGAAVVAGEPKPLLSVLCLVVALCLQIGVNFSNDYSDGVRGTDENRRGPARLTGSGAAKPKQVLAVALSFFALAGLAGLVVVVLSQYWWLLLVGAAAIAAAWFYTGGKRPYGYSGLGELFVFVFFGLVATAGTTFVQTGIVNQEAWLGGTAAGLFACAVLMVNNIRDIPSDRISGKRTLAVLVGPSAAKALYCIFILVPFGIAAVLALFYPFAWLAFFVLLAVLPAILITLTAKTAKELILALQITSISGLAYGIVLGIAFAF